MTEEKAVEKVATFSGFTTEEVNVIKQTVAKNINTVELAYFLNIAKAVELNPFTKEIWCYKDTKGNLLVFAGRDGFLKRAQQSPLWNGITSAEVCENDTFEMDVVNANISHKITSFKDRGEIVGAYAITKPKGTEFPTIEWVSIKPFDKKINAWSTHKADMIKKVAEVRALKKAYGITILQSEYDWEVKQGTATPIDITPKSDIELAERKILDALDAYQGEDKDELRRTCVNAKKENRFDMAFAEKTAAVLGVQL